MREHLDRIREGLEHYSVENHQPAIDEPANDYEKSVNELHALQGLQEEIKDLVKTLNEDERALRDSLAEGMRTFLGKDLKEGMNNYTLSNRRKLKFNNKVKREIVTPNISTAREAYAEAPDATIDFDRFLRVKYELDRKEFEKLVAGGPAAKAVAKMITSKYAAPEMEVD